MTEHHDTHRPPACRYDRRLRERVTRDHRDDCPNPSDHRGCAPCTAPHCLVCGREHATNDQPHTCPTCIGLIKDDLTDLATAYTWLAIEALDGGADGRLVAAAPIPGGNAAVLIGPTVRLDVMRSGRGIGLSELQKTHRPGDPLPALAVLAQWEDIYRTWLGHSRPTTSTTIRRAGTGATMTVPARASIGRAIAYLRDQVPYLANHLDGTEPDWLTFVHQVRALRADAERVLHDERDHEQGVECFECGDRLERRFRVARRCRHTTPARVALQAWVTRRNGAQDFLRDVVASYPELEGPRVDDLVAAAAPPAQLLADARRTCKECAVSPGGIDNPEPGQSWECPGCRKQYDPGEYATAVRRDLLDNGGEGDGWTQIGMAAQAATTAVGVHVLEDTVRKWATRGKVTACCLWTRGRPWGPVLVFWPDVADAAVEQLTRAREHEASRLRAAQEAEQFRAAVALAPAATDLVALGKGMGIHPSRVRKLVDELEHADSAGERIGA